MQQILQKIQSVTIVIFMVGILLEVELRLRVAEAYMSAFMLVAYPGTLVTGDGPPLTASAQTM